MVRDGALPIVQQHDATAVTAIGLAVPVLTGALVSVPFEQRGDAVRGIEAVDNRLTIARLAGRLRARGRGRRCRQSQTRLL